MIRQTIVAFALALGTFFFSVGAYAGDEALAEALFQEGQRLMVAKRYDQACSKFEDSLRIDASTGTLLNLASCREQQGRLATAWALYSKAANQARLAGHTDRETYAQQKVNDLNPKLSRLTINLDNSQDTTGMHVTLDEEPVSTAAFGFPFPVDAGEHRIVASQPGRQTWSARVTVGGSGAQESVVIPPLAPGGPPPTGAQPPLQPVPNDQATRIVQLRTELEDLREKRSDIGIGGGITMIAIGGGIAVISSLVLIAAAPDPFVDDGVKIASGLFLAGGLGLAAGGGALLGVRIKQRKALDPLIDQKVRELNALGVDISNIGFNPRLGTVVVTGTF